MDEIKIFFNDSLKGCKKSLHFIGTLFWWVAPLALFLLVLYMPKIVWDISFDNYLELIRILIWPITALIIVFFFKRVLTYLILSVREFSIFGVKGELKSAYDVINEKVNEKFENEKRERERESEVNRLQEEIDSKSGERDNIQELAKEVLSRWKKTIKDNEKLTGENRRLQEILERKSQAINDGVPIIINESGLGTGDKIDDSQPLEPSKEK